MNEFLDKPVEERPSEATSEAIHSAVAADMRPVHSLTVAQRAVLSLLVGAAGATAVMSTFGVDGISAALTSGIAIACGVVAIFGVAAVSLSLSPNRTANRGVRFALAAAVSVGWAAYLWSSTTPGSGPLFDAASVACGWRGLLGGAVIGAATMWIWRKTDPWSPRAAGALIGAAGGAIACAAVTVCCTAGRAAHLAIGHWLAIPIAALVLALIAPKVLAP